MTPAMREVYDFVGNFIDEHGYSPTYDEIKDGVGLASKSSVYRTVKQLARSGFIWVAPHRNRSIEIVKNPADRSAISQVRSYLVEISTTQQLSKAQSYAREALRCLP